MTFGLWRQAVIDSHEHICSKIQLNSKIYFYSMFCRLLFDSVEHWRWRYNSITPSAAPRPPLSLSLSLLYVVSNSPKDPMSISRHISSMLWELKRVNGSQCNNQVKWKKLKQQHRRISRYFTEHRTSIWIAPSPLNLFDNTIHYIYWMKRLIYIGYTFNCIKNKKTERRRKKNTNICFTYEHRHRNLFYIGFST